MRAVAIILRSTETGQIKHTYAFTDFFLGIDTFFFVRFLYYKWNLYTEFECIFPLCLSIDITEINSILTKLGISFFLILHSSQIGLSFLSIKKWLFGKVHGVSSFFSSEIKLKILKPNNWHKIESSSIWKPRKLLHTPTIQFCLKVFIFQQRSRTSLIHVFSKSREITKINYYNFLNEYKLEFNPIFSIQNTCS